MEDPINITDTTNEESFLDMLNDEDNKDVDQETKTDYNSENEVDYSPNANSVDSQPLSPGSESASIVTDEANSSLASQLKANLVEWNTLIRAYYNIQQAEELADRDLSTEDQAELAKKYSELNLPDESDSWAAEKVIQRIMAEDILESKPFDINTVPVEDRKHYNECVTLRDAHKVELNLRYQRLIKKQLQDTSWYNALWMGTAAALTDPINYIGGFVGGKVVSFLPEISFAGSTLLKSMAYNNGLKPFIVGSIASMPSAFLRQALSPAESDYAEAMVETVAGGLLNSAFSSLGRGAKIGIKKLLKKGGKVDGEDLVSIFPDEQSISNAEENEIADLMLQGYKQDVKGGFAGRDIKLGEDGNFFETLSTGKTIPVSGYLSKLMINSPNIKIQKSSNEKVREIFPYFLRGSASNETLKSGNYGASYQDVVLFNKTDTLLKVGKTREDIIEYCALNKGMDPQQVSSEIWGAMLSDEDFASSSFASGVANEYMDEIGKMLERARELGVIRNDFNLLGAVTRIAKESGVTDTANIRRFIKENKINDYNLHTPEIKEKLEPFLLEKKYIQLSGVPDILISSEEGYMTAADMVVSIASDKVESKLNYENVLKETLWNKQNTPQDLRRGKLYGKNISPITGEEEKIRYVPRLWKRKLVEKEFKLIDEEWRRVGGMPTYDQINNVPSPLVRLIARSEMSPQSIKDKDVKAEKEAIKTAIMKVRAILGFDHLEEYLTDDFTQILSPSHSANKEVTIKVADQLLADWLETDANTIYMIARINLKEKIAWQEAIQKTGYKDSGEILNAINEKFAVSEIKDKKYFEDLFMSLPDMVSGKDLRPKSELGANALIASKAFKSLVYAGASGAITASCALDYNFIVKNMGFGQTLKTLGATYKSFLENGALKASRKEAKYMSKLLEIAHDSASFKRIGDEVDVTKLSKYTDSKTFKYIDMASDWAGKKVAKITFLDMFDNFNKTIVKHAYQDMLASTLKSGDREAINNLLKTSRIDINLTDRIIKQIEDHAQTDSGLNILFTNRWRDTDAKNAVQMATTIMQDNTILKAVSGDLPQSYRKTLTHIMMFNTWTLKAHNIMMAYYRDTPISQQLPFIGTSIATGAALTAYKSLEQGKDIDTIESYTDTLSRSGLLGALEYATKPIMGAASWLLSDDDFNMSKSENVVGRTIKSLSPQASKIMSIYDIIREVGKDRPLSEATWRSIKSLVPGNNIPIIGLITNRLIRNYVEVSGGRLIGEGRNVKHRRKKAPRRRRSTKQRRIVQ